MLLAGTLNVLYGLVAIFNDEWVVWGNRGSVYFDITAWGWVHLILGIVLVAAGIGMMSGMMIARIVAVVAVGDQHDHQLRSRSRSTRCGRSSSSSWSSSSCRALIVHGREMKA